MRSYMFLGVKGSGFRVSDIWMVAALSRPSISHLTWFFFYVTFEPLNAEPLNLATET